MPDNPVFVDYLVTASPCRKCGCRQALISMDGDQHLVAACRGCEVVEVHDLDAASFIADVIARHAEMIRAAVAERQARCNWLRCPPTETEAATA